MRQGVRVLLFGPAAEMGNAGPGIEVIDAPLSIAKEANPAAAARAHPESSIVRAARAVANGDADALVSAGATGAALAAGLFNIKRDRGILRPALAAQVPVPGAPVTLVDVGANTEVRAEHLVQFAFMGAALASVVHGVDAPARRAAVGGRGVHARHAARARRPRAPVGDGGAELRRQHRGPRS